MDKDDVVGKIVITIELDGLESLQEIKAIIGDFEQYAASIEAKLFVVKETELDLYS